MPQTPDEFVYAGTFLAGLIFAVLSGIFSGFLGFGGDGGADTPGDFGHDVHFSPLSPVVIAMFNVSFGGTGIICKKMFNIDNIFIHLPISLLAGVIVAGGTFTFFVKLTAMMQKNSLVTTKDLIGLEAEVQIPIPGAEKVGQISYVVNGTRCTNAARSEDGTEIQAHTVVVITKVVGNTVFVNKKN